MHKLAAPLDDNAPYKPTLPLTGFLMRTATEALPGQRSRKRLQRVF